MEGANPAVTEANATILLSPRELARLLRVEQSTLAAWRRRGVGHPGSASKGT